MMFAKHILAGGSGAVSEVPDILGDASLGHHGQIGKYGTVVVETLGGLQDHESGFGVRIDGHCFVEGVHTVLIAGGNKSYGIYTVSQVNLVSDVLIGAAAVVAEKPAVSDAPFGNRRTVGEIETVSLETLRGFVNTEPDRGIGVDMNGFGDTVPAGLVGDSQQAHMETVCTGVFLIGDIVAVGCSVVSEIPFIGENKPFAD